jgi:hypothetical protein
MLSPGLDPTRCTDDARTQRRRKRRRDADAAKRRFSQSGDFPTGKNALMLAKERLLAQN